MPLAIGFCLLLLVPFVIQRRIQDARYKADPAVFERVEGGDTWYWRFSRWRGTVSAVGLASILLTLGIGKVMQMLNAGKTLYHLFGPFSGTEYLIVIFCLSLAIICAAMAVYDRLLKPK